MKILNNALYPIFILLLFISCKEPKSYEKFILNKDKTDLGTYEFCLDMSDSTRIYDLYLYTGIDEPGKNTQIPLYITWISPSGLKYAENVCFPMIAESRTFFSWTGKSPYRTSIVPKEYGRWYLSITAPEESEDFKLLGMGIVLEYKEK